MAGEKRKLLKKSDLNGNKPTSALDAALKAPVGSGFFKAMAAHAGEKLFGKNKKKQKFETIDGMKIAVRNNGGSVKRMNNGGAVMLGRGGKFKGIS
jgi:hypothetical protein